MRDADGHLRLANEGNEDAMAVDADHLALETLEGAGEDADLLVRPVQEILIGEDDALLIGVRARGGITEIVHLLVRDPEDALGMCGIEGLDRYELHTATDRIETLQQLQLNLHRAHEYHIIYRIAAIVFADFAKGITGGILKMKIDLIALTGQFITNAQCPLALSIADAHGIPMEVGIVGFFEDGLVNRLVGLEGEGVRVLEELGKGRLDNIIRRARVQNTSAIKPFIYFSSQLTKALTTAA